MHDMFIQVVNMSLTASWLILAVLLCRILLTRTSKNMICILWFIVGVRLIFPFSFASRMSVIPTVEPIVIHNMNHVLNKSEITVQGITEVYEVTSSVDMISIASFLWLAGVVSLFIYAIFSYWKMKRNVSASIEIGKDIYICDDIDGAFILGIMNPKIYLPSSLSYIDRKYVLMHEFMHLKRKDYITKLLAYVALIIHWFNPLVWISYVLLCKDMEMACDEQVIEDMDIDSKKEYSNTLLACSSEKPIFSCPVAFSEVGVKERVKNMLHFKKSSLNVLMISILVCITCVACFATKPVENNYDDASYEEWKKTWTNQFLYVSLASSPTWNEATASVIYNHWEIKEPVETRSMFVHDQNVDQTEKILIECLDKDEFTYTFYHHKGHGVWLEDDINKDYAITFKLKRDNQGIFSVEVDCSEALENYKEQLLVYELLNAEEAAKIALKYGLENFLDPRPTGE